MQPYGRGQMLGSGIDPRFNQMDYSGFVRAAETRAQAQAQLGKDIGGAISSAANLYMQNKDLTSKINTDVKSADKLIDSAINLFPNMSEQLNAARAELNDPNLSLRERGMVASSVTELLPQLINMQSASSQLQARNLQMQRMQSAGSGGGGAAPAAAQPRINPFTGQPF